MINRDYFDKTLRRLSPFHKVEKNPAFSSIRHVYNRRSLVSQAAFVYMRNLRKKQDILWKLLRLPEIRPHQIRHSKVPVRTALQTAKLPAQPQSPSDSFTKQKTPRVRSISQHRSYLSPISPLGHIQDVGKFSSDDQIKWEQELENYEDTDPVIQPENTTNQQTRMQYQISPPYAHEPARQFHNLFEEQPVQHSTRTTYLFSSVTPTMSIHQEDELDKITNPTECSCRGCQINTKREVNKECCIPPPRLTVTKSPHIDGD